MHKLCSLNLVTTKLVLAMRLGSSSFSTSQTIIIDARVGLGLVTLLCVIFSWIGCTHEISDSQILFALNNFYMCTLFTIQQLPEV